ncbi:MAG: sigma 54-interacting transcriptional regulator [Pyrinomonadaceae bacterium]
MLRCELARELESGGRYEAARGALGDLWEMVGESPRLTDLDSMSQAAVLLRSGVLIGYLGSSSAPKQPLRAQQAAKDLINEAINSYLKLGQHERAAEARIELAWCYRREGAFDEARALLLDAISSLAQGEIELRTIACVRRAMIEQEISNFAEALRILYEVSGLIKTLPQHHSLKGNYHNILASVLHSVGEAEQRADLIDQALIEYTAANFHFEAAGHTRNCAAVEHKLGRLHLTSGRLDKASEHLERARRLCETLKDEARIAVVDETRARLLLAEGRSFKAERLARVAVNILRHSSSSSSSSGAEKAQLIEAMTTHAVSLARLGQTDAAKRAFGSVIEMGERNRDCLEACGAAALALLEELSASLSNEELREAYDKADSLLRRSPQNAKTIERLRACARLVIDAAGKASAKMDPSHPSCAFVHASPRMIELLLQVERAARTDVTLLITGETGTGKEVLAAQIHAWSGRRGALVAVNCAGLNENLIESEVFGHRKGAFTDAIQDYAGAAKRASGGTLFLDEIGELSQINQAKLLRLLENKEIKAVGSDAAEQIDLRIIAATNRDLARLVRERRFRLDLYHRLCVFEVEIPPLRERSSDIRSLAEHFIVSALKRYQRHITFSEEAYAAIARLELPGNARELRSLIERTIILGSNGDEVTPLVVHRLASRGMPAAADADPSSEASSPDWQRGSLAKEIRAHENS